MWRCGHVRAAINAGTLVCGAHLARRQGRAARSLKQSQRVLSTAHGRESSLECLLKKLEPFSPPPADNVHSLRVKESLVGAETDVANIGEVGSVLRNEPRYSGDTFNLSESVAATFDDAAPQYQDELPHPAAEQDGIYVAVPDLHIPTHDDPVIAPDETGTVRTFTYMSNGQAAKSSPVVACAAYNSAADGERLRIFENAFETLKTSGYVVLERLLPAELLLEAGEEFRCYKDDLPDGVSFKRMRAQRDMTIPPFQGMWTEDWLVRHPLVMALIARYLRNSTDVSDEKAAEIGFAQWLTDGCDINHYLTGPASAGFPVLDLMVVVDTPSGAPAQTRHRDTILPGPCASIGMHIPLTPLQVSPLNGSIGFVPCTHRFNGKTGHEVVGAVPLGSVILYDSFLEHRGLENESSAPRAALFAWFRVPGVYSGHTQENFGEPGLRLTDLFRGYIGESLSKAVETERLRCPGGARPVDAERWGFRFGSELAPWGEERVCFRCDRTSIEGAVPPSLSSGRLGEHYCKRCWDECRSHGANPEPAAANVTPARQDNHYSEDRLEELQASGLNIRASRGRHKLTLLRERGLFLPCDPVSSWLARIPNDVQPSGWRDALKKALGEIPRYDGFG